MTTCKVPHTGDDAMPVALCRVCTPRETKAPVRDPALEQSRFVQNADIADKMAKRNLRKLRADVKRWRDRIELMEKYGKDTTKAKVALREAETALYLVA